MDVGRFIKITEIFLFLLLCSMEDIKEKRLSIKMLICFGVFFFISSFLIEKITVEERMQNMVPGMGALLIAFFTKEQLGYGDGICLLILGNLMPYYMLLGAVMSGLILLCFCSMMLLLRKRADGKTTLPFLPFFTVGTALQFIINS